MNELQELLNKAMPDIARRLLNELVITCPVLTGRLKNSLKVSATNEGLLIGGVEYLRWVEFGSPPHIIKPKNKKALHWGGKGGPIVKKVKHPGTRPNPFIRNALMTKLKNIIIEEITLSNNI